MSATKSDAINIFTCQKNRDYLRTVIPGLKMSDDQLQQSLNAFARNFISYTAGTQGLWAIVRHLNRLYVQDIDVDPSTADASTSFGDACWRHDELNVGLNTWDRCGEGGMQSDGTTWSDSAAGGYQTECSGQPNFDTTCCSDNRFTFRRNKYMHKGTGDWGKRVE